MAGGYNYVGGRSNNDVNIMLRLNNYVKDLLWAHYDIEKSKVEVRIANLLKGKYKLQVVLDISEEVFTMLAISGIIEKMTFEINSTTDLIFPLKDSVQIICKPPQ